MADQREREEIEARERQAAEQHEREREAGRAGNRLILRIAIFTIQVLAIAFLAWLPWLGAMSLFNWDGVAGPALLACILVVAVWRGRVEARFLSQAWRDWRALAAGHAPPDSRTDGTSVGEETSYERAIPDLAGAFYFSIVFLVIFSVFNGCGNLVNSVNDSVEQERIEERRQERKAKERRAHRE